MQEGGKLLVLGESALEIGGDRFLLDVGATYLGPAHYATDYLLVGEELGSVLGRDLVTSPFFNYTSAIRVQPDANAEVLAQIVEPYFDRTYATYCSHLNTPNRLEPAAHPGAVRSGNVIFLPHRLGALYFAHGARLHRDFVVNALRTLYTEPTVEADLPSAARISLLHQAEQKRYVAHLLYAPPLQRGRCLVIEDLPPVYDAQFTVRLPEDVSVIRSVPELESGLLVEEGDGAITVTVPRFQCHQAVVSWVRVRNTLAFEAKQRVHAEGETERSFDVLHARGRQRRDHRAEFVLLHSLHVVQIDRRHNLNAIILGRKQRFRRDVAHRGRNRSNGDAGQEPQR